ncbi:MAG: iron export ABC transporter permease subunit FetB [Rhodospirillales bacterium]|nr:iron export ABC transporter permease subunit FetB [Rhodospirillales bacterium]MBO6788398.1 iron export ABC transporter permease subunit FetB [Rhodospirillales bacterium]
MNYIQLSYWDIALAASFLTVNAGLSIYYGLGTERRLLIAAARMVVQLTLVGLVLKALFATVSPWLTLLVGIAMVAFAGREAMARQERTFIGFWGYGLGTASMLAAAGVVTVFTLSTQVHADPWYDPRYAIPILGMILGNTMTGVSLALDRLLSEADNGRGRIEARLALGHTFRQAMQEPLKGAMRAGLIPTVNGMAAAGLVSLPGMMTGQILAGVDPVEAVKYQLLIMFLIAGGTALGVFSATMVALRRLTDARQRLRLDRLRTG